MSLQLKNPTELFPPGGFGFQDPKTGMLFNGLEGSPDNTAAKVIAHRQANPAIYPADSVGTIESVIQEIFAQKNQTMPWLFSGGPEDPGLPAVVVAAPNLGSCVCGATAVDPIYCPTCGGQRITGYKCKACGAERQ